MMYKYKKMIIFTVIFIAICVFSNRQMCFGEEELAKKKILVLCSYNIQNKWEESVVKGLKKHISDNMSISIDFLDSKSIDTDIYNESFIELLNLKYKYENIDCVLAVDDEALELVKSNLFNKESFLYKKPVVFVGVNGRVFISEEENKYITGIIEQQDNRKELNLIMSYSKNIQNIYLILDNSIYSTTLKENIKSLKKFTEMSYKTHIIEDYDFNIVKEKLKDIDESKSAIILSATYKDSNGNEIQPKEIVSEIKKSTKAPLYAKLGVYIDAGAIGGIINDGEKLGQMASNLLDTVLFRNKDEVLTSLYSSINAPVYNYEALMEYNINPWKLPKDSIIINKAPYELLAPKYIKLFIWILIIVVILAIMLFIHLFIHNKRRVVIKGKLLAESIERNEIKTDFILTVSHELRTPLNIIINATKLLKYKINNNEYSEEYTINQLNMINKNSNRLLRLINNLIDVSKIESGHIDTTFKNENIVDVVEDSTMSVVDLAKAHNIEITFDTDDEEIIISIDRQKIERVMLNLLSNSIKFTNSGGHIFVSIRKDENIVMIKVEDDGIGMTEEFQSQLFNKFKRVTSYPSLERNHEGSGLGLFIVKGLIEVHRGTIDVESAINEGTTFTILLPRVMVDSESSNADLMKLPIEYTSQIELADINSEDDTDIK